MPEPSNPLDFYERSRRRQAQRQSPEYADPVEITVRNIQRNRLRQTSERYGSPDTVARVNRVAQSTGQPIAVVEDRLEEIEAAQQRNTFLSVIDRSSGLARWAGENPRAAAAAQDDAESLGALGTAWDILKNLPGRIRGEGGERLSRSMAAIGDTAQNLFWDTMASDDVTGTWGITQAGNEEIAQQGRFARAQNLFDLQERSRQAQRAADRNRGGNYFSETFLSGTASIPAQVLGVGTAVVTRNPYAGAAVIGGVTANERTYDGRIAGLNESDALIYGSLQGAIEGATELPAVGVLADAVLTKTPFGRNLIRGLLTENIGEQIATHSQDFVDWSMLPENADKTLEDYALARPQAFLDTVIATTGASTVQTAAATAINRSLGAAERVSERLAGARQARAENVFLERAGRAVEGMNLRQRDSEGQREMLRVMAEEAGTTDVFIPGEAIRAFQQSDGYDWDADPFRDYNVQEAFATGGDVVIPLHDALTDLVGTPAWEALRADMRLTAGGQSLREAETFEAAMDEFIAETTDAMARGDAQEAKGRSIRERLTERAAEMFGVSYTSPAARSYAELAVQRIATRAARMGRELDGSELDGFDVRQVMPEGVAEAVKADTIDLTINAMRQRNPVETGEGESLIQWIRKRGGVYDVGGDLASMGFPKNLIRKPPTGAMFGPGFDHAGRGQDTTFREAIDDGFFPEFYHMQHEGGVDRVDDNWFRDAIAQELAGKPRYRSMRTDPARAAGADLRGWLVSSGYDPDAMTDAQIREVIAGMAQEASEGGYEQAVLPDTLDIDGVARPTVNSLGMPLARDEAGVRAFWAWFGDSKVVDAGGKPLVVYHGTTATFDQFKTDGRWKTEGSGAFFTSDPEVAGTYVRPQGDEVGAPQIYPVYLALDNMPVVDFEGANWSNGPRMYEVAPTGDSDGEWFENKDEAEAYADELRAELAEDGEYLGDEDIVQVIDYGVKLNEDGFLEVEWDSPDSGTSTDGLGMDARIAGFDGLKLENVKDHGGRSVVPDMAGASDIYVAFRPEQIKSINNRGTFSPDDPRILYQEARGRIIFDQDKRIIDLFQSRNLSTPIHELGHMWLEELRADAAMPDAPEQLRQDWETARAWFTANGHAIGEDGVIPVEAHEVWARGIERYVMEGKAPSTALTRLFETFRGWLVNIYKTVQKLNAPITPEMREVFDRMLATDEEIAQARDSQVLGALFKEAADLGMAGDEFAAYQRQVSDAQAGAHAALLDKTMKAVRRRETERYREARKGVRAEQQERIDASPLYRALANMKANRVNKTWIADNMGLDALDLLPKRVPPLYVEGGLHPDILAEMSGYTTGTEMLESIIGAERLHRQAKEGGDTRSMRDRAIETATDAEMDRRYGDPLNDGSIEREALAAVHSEMQGEVMATELRVLARGTTQRPTPYRLAREWARGKIRAGTVALEASPSAVQRYARNAAKAGRAAEQAMIKGDRPEAFRQKQAQMLNSALLAEAKTAMDEVDAAVKRMGKIAAARTRKSVDQDYLEQAHALLEAVDLRKRSQVSIDRKGKFEAWVKSRADGEEVYIPERFDWSGVPWSRMSTVDLLGLDDTIKSIMHLGGLKQTMLDNKEQREFDEWKAEALANLEAAPGRKLSENTDEPKRPIAGIFSNLMKMSVFAAEMDNDKRGGVWQRLLVWRATDAANYRDAMRDEVLNPIADAYNAISRKDRNRLAERVAVPELPYRSADENDPRVGRPRSLTRWEILGLALNMGTDAKFDKLARGYGVTQDAIERVVFRELTEQDWAFASIVWAQLDLLRPHIAKAEREMSGVEPEWQEGRVIQTPFGPVTGGYYPTVYDPAQSQSAEDNSKDEANDMFGSKSGVATAKGHTISLTGYAAPLLLSPESVLFTHVEKVITRNAYAPWVRDVLKAVKTPAIRATIDRKFGPEFREQIEPWLRQQVREAAVNEGGVRYAERFLRQARVNLTVVSMGLRWSTGVAQTLGLANSAGRIGFNNLRRGMQQMLLNPSAAVDFVFERSPEMAKRNQAMNQDVVEVFRAMRNARLSKNAASRGFSAAQAKAQSFAFWHIGMIDRYVVSIPTWLGGYQKALREGSSEEEAIRYADWAVNASQGGGRAKDLAAWQSNQVGEGLRLFTMFYTPFNVLLNAQWEAGRAARRGDYRKTASLVFWFMIATPLLEAMLAGDAPDDDDEEESWAAWLARNVGAYSMAGIPIVRDATNYVERKISGQYATFSPGPIGRIFEASEDATVLAWDATLGEDDVSDRWLRTAIETPGYFLGLPTGQVAATANFMKNAATGEEDPRGFWDWYTGLTKGRIED